MYQVKAVFCDIDDTITTLGADKVPDEDKDQGIRHYHHLVARNILMTKHRISKSEANQRIQQVDDHSQEHDFFYFLPKLQITFDEMWQGISDWEDINIEVFDDAIEMIKILYREGFPLYTVSNNGVWGTLGKLRRAGLGDKNGSEYFKKRFSFEIFQCNKKESKMYSCILETENLDPSEVVMIGDSYSQDCEIPHQAGIEKCIIVDREQTEEILKQDQCVSVKSLKTVPSLLRLEN